MKTIPLKEAHEILERFTSAVVIDDSVLTYPRLSELKDSEDNEFLYLSWEDEGLEYSLKFSEGKNQMVKISGSSMFLNDDDAETDADQTQLTILDATPIEHLVTALSYSPPPCSPCPPWLNPLPTNIL